MPGSPAARVLMVNPQMPDLPPQEVSRRQFDLVWEARGWVLHDPGSGPQDPPADEAPAKARNRKTTTPAPAADAVPDAPKEN